jgi:uncharacterized membrane protein HdeD (DUF308 family)
MLNFWNAVWGILMLILGLLLFGFIIKERIKGDKDRYGNRFEIYGAAILSILLGLTLLIKVLMKL